MYVSFTKTKASPEQPLEDATIAGEAMHSWLSQIEGFDGLLMLTNQDAGTTLALAFWENREVAERHRQARREFRDRITAAVNVDVVETADFDVSFCSLGPRLAQLQAE